jgi:hypothetical protein
VPIILLDFGALLPLTAGENPMAIVELSGLGTTLSGKVGNTGFADTPYGTVMRSLPTINNPRSARQTAQRNRMTQAIAAYQTLTLSEAEAWRAFALSGMNRDPDTGKQRGKTAYSAFTGLTCRFLHVNPDGSIPRLPPSFPYAGDPVALTVSTASNEIIITASHANTAPTHTELLLQSLKYPAQSPHKREYLSMGFFAFTSENLSVALPAEPGWYAVASCFINADTGQYASRQFLGVIEVPAG